VTREELELFPDIRDWDGSSRLSRETLVSDLQWNLCVAFRDFSFFKHPFWYKNRLLKSVSHLLIFVIRENEILISVIRDSLFVPFVNRARDLPVPPCPKEWGFF